MSSELRFRGDKLLAAVFPAGVELVELAGGVAIGGDEGRAPRRVGEEGRVRELRLHPPLLLLELGDPLLDLGDSALDRAQHFLALLPLPGTLPPRLHSLSATGSAGERRRRLGCGSGAPARPVVEIAGLGIDPSVADLPDLRG